MSVHCAACGGESDRILDYGCGDPSCCGYTYGLDCNCPRGRVCTLDGDDEDCAGCRAMRAPSESNGLGEEGK